MQGQRRYRRPANNSMAEIELGAASSVAVAVAVVGETRWTVRLPFQRAGRGSRDACAGWPVFRPALSSFHPSLKLLNR